VLPADSETDWQPTAVASRAPLRSGAPEVGSHDRFISTPSGRFAYRAPADANGSGRRSQPSFVASAYIEGMAGVSMSAQGTATVGSGSATTGSAGDRAASDQRISDRAAADGTTSTGTARQPRFTAPAPEAPRGPDGKPRPPRHRSRPMRQAVLSAVTLGAVGAAAAATAALLGITSDGHSSQLLDSTPSQDPAGVPGGGLIVSVSTPPVPLASSSIRSSPSRGRGKNGASGIGIGGIVHSPPGTAPGSGSGSDSGASAADFHVSINQRDADPNSVTIVLRNSGSAPIAWQAAAHDTWIALSQSSGTLGGGQSQAIVATVTSAAPSGPWTSTITFSPGGAVVTLHGGSSNPSSAPASPPASGGSSQGSTPPGTPSAGSTSTPTPRPTPSDSARLVSPSAVGPTRTAPAGGGASASAPASSPTSQGSQSSAPRASSSSYSTYRAPANTVRA
jgi:hypothetical protein